MENDNNQLKELSLPKVRSRRNSLQPIDRHINDVDFDGSICINAGIDSTCAIKRNSKVEFLTNTNSTSIENK